MDDLSNHWKSLSLSEKEGTGLSLKSDQATTTFSIIARFLTKRPINLDAIANTFNPLWRTRNGFRMKFIEDHLILFSFDSKEEVDRILAAEPWSFDKCIMVLSRYEHSVPIYASDMTSVSFWIQVHDIPLSFRNKEVAEQICEVIGSVTKLENPNDCDGGTFIRVCVVVNISLPLCRGRLITLDNNKVHWVSFKYERLPNLCYWCGCLTHPDKDCECWIESEGSLNKEEQHYGPWLKAASYMASRKSFLSVPGFYASMKTDKPGQKQAGTHSHKRDSPNTTASETPLALSPKNQEHSLSPKIVEQDANTVSISPQGQSSTDTDCTGPPFLGSTLKPTQPLDFGQLTEEVDVDIRCFDNADPACYNVNNCHLGRSPLLVNEQESLNGSPTKGPLTKPRDSNPTQDTNSTTPAQNLMNPANDKKWVRMQRPTHIPVEENAVVSLGKRGPSPTLEYSRTQK